MSDKAKQWKIVWTILEAAVIFRRRNPYQRTSSYRNTVKTNLSIPSLKPNSKFYPGFFHEICKIWEYRDMLHRVSIIWIMPLETDIWIRNSMLFFLLIFFHILDLRRHKKLPHRSSSRQYGITQPYLTLNCFCVNCEVSLK